MLDQTKRCCQICIQFLIKFLRCSNSSLVLIFYSFMQIEAFKIPNNNSKSKAYICTFTLAWQIVDGFCWTDLTVFLIGSYPSCQLAHWNLHTKKLRSFYFGTIKWFPTADLYIWCWELYFTNVKKWNWKYIFK